MGRVCIIRWKVRKLVNRANYIVAAVAVGVMVAAAVACSGTGDEPEPTAIVPTAAPTEVGYGRTRSDGGSRANGGSCADCHHGTSSHG